MPDIESRMEAMLFNYQTTYRTDFRRGEVTAPTYTKYKEKPTCLRPRPPPLKDIHTLTPWKRAAIPFSLMHKPRPIIGTDPNKVQEPYVGIIDRHIRYLDKKIHACPPVTPSMMNNENHIFKKAVAKLTDTAKPEVIKTRPRVVLTPAVSLDDITSPKMREILCDYTYTSNMTRANREAIVDYFTVKAPLPGLPAKSNPVTLPPLRFPYVSPEWRMETVTWDKKQLRSYCDPTKEFWLRQELPPCIACRETEIVKADRKLRNQMKTGRSG